VPVAAVGQVGVAAAVAAVVGVAGVSQDNTGAPLITSVSVSLPLNGTVATARENDAVIRLENLVFKL